LKEVVFIMMVLPGQGLHPGLSGLRLSTTFLEISYTGKIYLYKLIINTGADFNQNDVVIKRKLF